MPKKLCMLSCGYLHTFSVYGGKPASRMEKGLAKKVVLDLLEPFEGLNHVDNFFTTLVEALATKQIVAVGIIKQCVTGFPDSKWCDTDTHL